jgi:hypothetical protein
VIFYSDKSSYRQIMDLQQQLAQLSQAVSIAYQAYTKCPVYVTYPAAKEAVAIIDKLQPQTFTNITPIFAFEATPNIPGYPIGEDKGDPSFMIPKGPLGGGDTQLYASGYHLFGFAATVAASVAASSINILVIRGTITPEEAGASLWYWSSTSPCALPTGKPNPKNLGAVKAGFWSFYAGTGVVGQASLATSLKAAVAAVAKAAPKNPWHASGHSLGGALLCLGLMDAAADGLPVKPALIGTFGSVVVGDAQWARSYTLCMPNTVRVVNLCDFVPSLRSLLPGDVNVSYTHVGEPAQFVWQTDSDWGNHSLEQIYMPMVNSPADFSLIVTGAIKYPAKVGQKFSLRNANGNGAVVRYGDGE